MQNTYWNHTGRYEKLNEKLHARIDEIIEKLGDDNVRKTGLKGFPKTEKLRKAKLAYYDIFNNGGGNYMAQVRGSFGFGMTSMIERRWGSRGESITYNWERIHEIVEPIMDRLILEAAIEQDLIEDAA